MNVDRHDHALHNAVIAWLQHDDNHDTAGMHQVIDWAKDQHFDGVQSPIFLYRAPNTPRQSANTPPSRTDHGSVA